MRNSRASLQAQHEDPQTRFWCVAQTMRVEIRDILITEISGNLESLMFLVTDDMDALYENSKLFMTFLKKRGLDHVLSEMKLTLRETHTTVPPVSVHIYQPARNCFTFFLTRQRIGAPLGAKRNALPNFPDDESWYFHVRSHITFEVVSIGFDPVNPDAARNLNMGGTLRRICPWIVGCEEGECGTGFLGDNASVIMLKSSRPIFVIELNPCPVNVSLGHIAIAG